MNLLVTLDSGYVGPLCVMLRSLSVSCPGESVNLYIAHSRLTENDIKKIKNALADIDSEVYPITIDESLFENAPTKKRITKETYYRVFAPLYLPKSVDRILYIDPDTVILNSLHSFYFSDFGDNLIIAAKHFDGAMDRWNRFRLTLVKSKRYVNAGVMLMNIEKMRGFITSDKILKCVRFNRGRLFLADQDAINILFDGLIKVVSEYRINLDERCFARLLKIMPLEKALENVDKNTIIVHFNGKEKPWKDGYNGYLKCFYDRFATHSTADDTRCFDA